MRNEREELICFIFIKVKGEMIQKSEGGEGRVKCTHNELLRLREFEVSVVDICPPFTALQKHKVF